MTNATAGFYHLADKNRAIREMGHVMFNGVAIGGLLSAALCGALTLFHVMDLHERTLWAAVLTLGARELRRSWLLWTAR